MRIGVISRLTRVGIDIGGTFTDLIGMDDAGDLVSIKVPTTPRTPEEGVIVAFENFLKEHDPRRIDAVTHATTITTNALLGQVSLELPRTALITTKGFGDIIEIARQRRPELYNIFFERPRQLIQRRYRYEVNERIAHDGEEIEPVQTQDLERVVQDIEREDIRSVAVGFINSYANPSHENLVKKHLKERLPLIDVTASCDISPEYREYERISTAVVNAVLLPIVRSYITKLVKALKELGVERTLYLMQSNGGLSNAEDVVSRPATIVESGPASGVIASAFYGRVLGLDNIISFDMGGTTAKAGSVIRGTPEVVSEYEVGGTINRGRVVKGSGYPVRFPFIDLAECSSGGGTIAWVDRGKALHIGPTSVGAEPGPACYGKGNAEPTITDANLIVGRLNPSYLLGGAMRINKNLASEAVRVKIGAPLGLDVHEAAISVVKIANSTMSKILRMVSVEKGYDPRSFSLLAFGGAGPMHACSIAEDLNIGSILVPPNPGLFSAVGLLVSDVVHSFLTPVMKTISQADSTELEDVFDEMETRGKTLLERNGFAPEQMMITRALDARYVGQSYELTVPTLAPFTAVSIKRFVENFHEKHRDVYGYSSKEDSVEIVNARLNATGLMKKPSLRTFKLQDPEPSHSSLVERRPVFFEDKDDQILCPVYIRDRLEAGNRITGPAIIEQYDSTTVVYPDWNVLVDKYGNLRMTKEV